MISIPAIRKHLALPKTSWQICLLAIVGGAASALLVVLFILTIEEIQQLYLVKRDNYNSLDSISRFDLPIIGAIIILTIGWLTGYKYLRTGIAFVLHRLKVAHGVMPFKNTLNQFFGSAIALASGFSVGREGPAVHLGAACSSYLGHLLKLPYNSIRTLCACGIAAGIAATFNTPIAAVIFVMEVIMREYKIHIFIPVMLAAIVGSLITQTIFGTSHHFEYFSTITLGHGQYFFLIILGIFLGILAALFNKSLVTLIKRSATMHIIPRLMLAAFITGSLGYLVPGAMGTGSSAIDFSLEHHWQISLLLSLLIAKLLMTISALGLGIPGGIVGPVIGIGAITGACAGAIVMQIIPGENLASDYILMGMAGFMAATLNAPLAALLAVVELTSQLEIIVPAMIVITVASVISKQVFENRSIFTMQLDVQNLIYHKPPIEEALQKIGVLAIMKDKYKLFENATQRSLAGEIVSTPQDTLIINKVISNKESEADITYYWAEFNAAVPLVNILEHQENPITQPEIPEHYEQAEYQVAEKMQLHQLLPLSSQATLAEAYLALVQQRKGGVYIYQKDHNDFIGIVTFEQIRYYLVEGKLI
ncbi:chloride channel protein [Litorilituus lipolyticus]|uniref:Chloride channel protein n=1 Tax=Litorilituus lipolyticus TaxID=2491017 RepID=A0A502L5S3_9GAMM|nr:chloride channel protein [Litorilituus lipolyticus]TPH17825.1 chloride channel protein [Litorilituus lipolyticus]